MPDQVVATINFKTTGAGGVINQTKKISGTIDEVVASLRTMSKTSAGGFGREARAKIKAFTDELIRTAAASDRVQGSLSGIGKGFVGAGKLSGRATGRVRGFRTIRSPQRIANQIAAEQRRIFTQTRKILRSLFRRTRRQMLLQASQQVGEQRRLTMQSTRILERRNQEILSQLEEDGGEHEQLTEKMGRAITEAFEETVDSLKRNLNVDKTVLREKMRAERAQAKTARRQQGGGFGFGGALGAVLPAAGFGAIQLGTTIEQIFANRRIEGTLQAAFSGIASTFSALLGETIGQIAADIAKAIGGIFEITINALTLQFRLLGIAFGGALKGIGITLIGALGVALTPAGIGIPILIGAIIAAVTALSSVIREIFNEIGSIIKIAFSTITGIVSAGLRTIFAITKGILGAFVAVWKGAWTAITSVTKGAIETIKASLTGLGGFMRIAISEFAKLEEFSTRAFTEVIDIADKTGTLPSDFARIITQVQATFGTTFEDAFKSVFDAVSSGFRSVKEAAEIANFAGKLALGSESDLATATNTLITAVQNYGLETLSLAEASRILSAATTLGRANLQEFAPALKSVAGLAARLNISFRDVAGSIALFTRFFGRGSAQTSARFLNRLIEAIALPSSRARKSFEEIGIEVKESGDLMRDFVNIVEQLSKISLENLRKVAPTIQARRGLIAFTADPSLFRKIRDEIAGLEKFFEKSFKLVQATIAVSGRRIAAITRGIFAGIGRAILLPLAPFIKKFTDVFSTLVIFSKKEFKQLQKNFKAFDRFLRPLFTAIFNPLLDGIRLLRRLMFDVDVGELFNLDVIMMVKEAITGIVRNIILLPKFLDDAFGLTTRISSAFSGIWKLIKNIVKVISSKTLLSDILAQMNALKIQVAFVKNAFVEIFGDRDKRTKFIFNFERDLRDLFANTSIDFGKFLLVAVKLVGSFITIIFGRKLQRAAKNFAAFLLDGLADVIEIFAKAMDRVIFGIAKKLSLAFTDPVEFLRLTLAGFKFSLVPGDVIAQSLREAAAELRGIKIAAPVFENVIFKGVVFGLTKKERVRVGGTFAVGPQDVGGKNLRFILNEFVKNITPKKLAQLGIPNVVTLEQFGKEPVRFVTGIENLSQLLSGGLPQLGTLQKGEERIALRPRQFLIEMLRTALALPGAPLKVSEEFFAKAFAEDVKRRGGFIGTAGGRNVKVTENEALQAGRSIFKDARKLFDRVATIVRDVSAGRGLISKFAKFTTGATFKRATFAQRAGFLTGLVEELDDLNARDNAIKNFQASNLFQTGAKSFGNEVTRFGKILDRIFGRVEANAPRAVRQRMTEKREERRRQFDVTVGRFAETAKASAAVAVDVATATLLPAVPAVAGRSLVDAVVKGFNGALGLLRELKDAKTFSEASKLVPEVPGTPLIAGFIPPTVFDP